MANRSMVFAARALPTKPGETVAVLALGEFGWDIPLLYKLLVSVEPRTCHSVVFDNAAPLAIAGDRQGGLNLIKAIRAKLPAGAPAIPSLDAAIAYLGKPHIDHPYFLLEPGEILALGTGDMQAGLEALFAEVKALRQDDTIALARKSDEARYWAAESWSSILYFQPAGSERPPIDPGEGFLTTTPAHLLENRDVLPRCKDLTSISIEFGDGDDNLAAALDALGAVPGPFSLKLYGRCERLPDTIAAAKTMTTLAAGSLGLRALPDGLASLPRLTELYLQANAFDTAPEILRRMPQLTSLSLGQNAIRALPSWTGEWTNLEGLNAEDCRLTDLPGSLWTLKKLKTLQLSHNPHLTQIPEAIAGLQGLETINLHSCGLTRLPEALGRLPRLKEVWIANNRLKTLPKSLYAKPLDTLSLGGNPMRPAPWYAFWSSRRFRAKTVYWR